MKIKYTERKLAGGGRNGQIVFHTSTGLPVTDILICPEMNGKEQFSTKCVSYRPFSHK